MPPLPCVARAARSTNSLRTLSFSHSPTTPVRSLSSTASRRAGHSEESPYDPPSGNLFGVPPGEKYQNEGWERLWVWGFWGTCGLATVAYCFKPDTSIQTWALEEARRRLEAEGILKDESAEKS